jgi:tetratricopeptide (TPR) repeat protein
VRGHGKAPDIDRARWILADVYVQYGSGENPAVPPLERAGYLERAVKEYDDIARRFPGSELAEQSYIEKGDVLLTKLKRPDDALAAYKSGSVNARRLGATFASRIAQVYIGTGRTAEADTYLRALSRAGNPDLAQAGQFYTGVNLAMKKEYALARDTLTALAESAPHSAYTNDAIETAWVVEEALQYQSKALPVYVEAMRARMIGDTAAVVARLTSIVEMPVHETLRPRALFWLGRTLRQTGDLHGALAALRRFLEEYPDEQMRPDVKREVAAVYEFGFEQYARALSEYESVLIEFPEYAFLDEVRQDVRRLRYIVKGEGDAN